ncbi:MAG: ABC transporter substrate-binding protein [Magnetococcales bacterium]|nr:ABC transporter substrate-binding protein [Magnetococcales bacterium]
MTRPAPNPRERSRLFATAIPPLLLLLLLTWCQPLLAESGISLDGKRKYGNDFQGFDYTSPEAKVGGTLVLHSLGGFDKMNPYTLKGTPPDLLGALVFERLTVPSLDEPFAHYGLLAESIDLAEDGLSLVYTLHPKARFADGSPVTAQDVKFSLETMKSDKASPGFQAYWRDIQGAEVIDTHRVRFLFSRKNRELPLIAGEIPIFSRAYFEKIPFDKDDLTPPLGSGPYLVESVDPGRTITYKRNPEYWGWERPVNRGMYNFERIVVKYYLDPVVALEAFKAEEFDFISENNSKQWARDYEGSKFTSGELRKELLHHKNGAGIQGFAFNLRRPLFKDLRVRQALSLAFDFEWSNRNLFYDQYRRSESYFSNSEMAAVGKPTPEELAILEPLRAKLDPVVFEAVQPPPSTTPPASLRENLLKAKELLTAAGWRMGPDKVLVDGQGNRFAFEVLLSSPAFERIMAPYAANLKKLGVAVSYRTVDLSLYQRRLDEFDYDLIVAVFPQSQSPGNEQRSMWHSTSATIRGSQNRIGLADPAVDALVENIIQAQDRKTLIAACRSLDRVLLAGHYLVPHWYLDAHRIAFKNRFARPATQPLFFSPEDWLFSWWVR